MALAKQNHEVTTHDSVSLKKHNGAIQISNRVSLFQRKLWNVLIHLAYPDLLNKRVHKVKMADLKKLVGFQDSNDYSHIVNGIDALMGTTVEWSLIDKDESFAKSTLLSAAVYKGGVISYEFSQALSEKLYEPSIYGVIDLRLQNKLGSKYALALYENCVRFLPERESGFISVDVFMDLLGCPNYQFRDFNRFCLAPAREEVNNVTDLTIDFEFQRAGRKIIGIKVIVNLNPQKALELGEEAAPVSINQALIKTLVEEFRVSQKKAETICLQFDDEYIQKKLDYARAEIAGGRKIANLAGFVVKAIDEDYATAKLNSDVKKKQEKAQVIQIDAAKKQVEAQRNAELKALNSRTEELYNALSEDQQLEILSEFAEYARQHNSAVSDSYRKSRLSSPMVRTYFLSFLRGIKHIGV